MPQTTQAAEEKAVLPSPLAAAAAERCLGEHGEVKPLDQAVAAA